MHNILILIFFFICINLYSNSCTSQVVTASFSENLITTYIQSNITTCSKEIGKLDNFNCLDVRIEINEFSPEAFLDILTQQDNNHLVRKINIKINTNNNEMSSHEVLGYYVDEFILPRPWWIIATENYHGYHSHKHPTHIIFLRVGQLYEPRLRIHAAVQYPPSEYCEQSRLSIGHMVNAGYGTLMLTYPLNMARDKFQIFDIYDSNTNQPNEGVNYVSMADCPGLVNRRLCAFLPLTNCSYPKELTDIKDVNQFKESFKENSGFVFFPVDNKWVRVAENSNSVFMSDYHEGILKSIPDIKPPNFISDIFYLGHRLREPCPAKYCNDNVPNVDALLAGLAFLLRLNSHFRFLVQNRIHEMKSKIPMVTHGNKLQCTSIHIRRGDHMAQDPTSFDVPLEKYLERAYTIHKTKNAFIFGDDE